MTVTPITIADLTAADTSGSGALDVLMRSVKAHMDQEWDKQRIRGTEYTTLYLGALQTAMATALQFVAQTQQGNLDAQLKDAQLSLAAVELQKAQQELTNLQKQQLQIEAQTALIQQQKTNLVAEALNIPKQGALLDAQAAHSAQETTNLVSQKALIDSQKSQADQQTTNLAAQKLVIDAQKLQIVAETAFTDQRKANAIIEGDVLTAQQCKLQAEYDVLMLTKDKTVAETNLLAQKQATERAQVLATGVDADSVVGKQKALYAAQTAGYNKDAIQKAVKMMLDTWSVRRTTDEATSANSTNKLDDASIGTFVTMLQTSIGA